MFNRQSSTGNPFGNFGNGSRNAFGNCNEFFGQGFGRHGADKRREWKEKIQGFFAGKKAANILEDDHSFTISLYAAGLEKNNFKVSVNDDVLTIQYTAPEENDDAKYAHREYKPVSFERSFQLNGRVLTDNVQASYTDGVLKISLQKNPETNKPAQEITVD